MSAALALTEGDNVYVLEREGGQLRPSHEIVRIRTDYERVMQGRPTRATATALEMVDDAGQRWPALIVLDIFDGTGRFLSQWWSVNARYVADREEAAEALMTATASMAEEHGLPVSGLGDTWTAVRVEDWRANWALHDAVTGAEIVLRNFMHGGHEGGSDHRHGTLH